MCRAGTNEDKDTSNTLYYFAQWKCGTLCFPVAAGRRQDVTAQLLCMLTTCHCGLGPGWLYSHYHLQQIFTAKVIAQIGPIVSGQRSLAISYCVFFYSQSKLCLCVHTVRFKSHFFTAFHKRIFLVLKNQMSKGGMEGGRERETSVCTQCTHTFLSYETLLFHMPKSTVQCIHCMPVPVSTACSDWALFGAFTGLTLYFGYTHCTRQRCFWRKEALLLTY